MVNSTPVIEILLQSSPSKLKEVLKQFDTSKISQVSSDEASSLCSLLSSELDAKRYSNAIGLFRVLQDLVQKGKSFADVLYTVEIHTKICVVNLDLF